MTSTYGSDRFQHNYDAPTPMHLMRRPPPIYGNRGDATSFYPTGVTQFYPRAEIYAPDMVQQQWSDANDQLALANKIAENNIRPEYKKREHMSDRTRPHNDEPILGVNVLCYIFIFVIVIFLALHHMMSNQLENVKELFRMIILSSCMKPTTSAATAASLI